MITAMIFLIVAEAMVLQEKESNINLINQKTKVAQTGQDTGTQGP